MCAHVLAFARAFVTVYVWCLSCVVMRGVYVFVRAVVSVHASLCVFSGFVHVCVCSALGLKLFHLVSIANGKPLRTDWELDVSHDSRPGAQPCSNAMHICALDVSARVCSCARVCVLLWVCARVRVCLSARICSCTCVLPVCCVFACACARARRPPAATSEIRKIIDRNFRPCVKTGPRSVTAARCPPKATAGVQIPPGSCRQIFIFQNFSP